MPAWGLIDHNDASRIAYFLNRNLGETIVGVAVQYFVWCHPIATKY